MKKNYKIPDSEPVQFWPEMMLAASFGAPGAGDDATMDPTSDFDTFFGA